MSQINYQGPKWVHLRKYYPNCDMASDTNIWMTDVQGGDLSGYKSIFSQLSILDKLLIS